MGMTFWIHTLDGGIMSHESDDHTLMYRLSDELDAVCDELGISKLSSFVDYTDLVLNMTDDESDEENEAIEIGEETGYAYAIDDMQWFDIPTGLTCLEALRRHVADGWNPELAYETRAYLIEELDNCIEKLKSLSQETGKFHLAVLL